MTGKKRDEHPSNGALRFGVTRSRRNGASEGIRTLDIHLGKVTLYQTELRSLPLEGSTKVSD